MFELVRSGAYAYIHFGLPCTSWSCWQRLNPNSTRSSEHPEGENPTPSELAANLLASRTASLCLAQQRAGGFWSVENPGSSLVWSFGPIEALLRHGVDVNFDQCMYGLTTDPGLTAAKVKKSTRIRTNMLQLLGLERQCSKDHKHQRCGGKIRTPAGWINRSSLAGQYPAALCEPWAAAVCSSLAAPGR